MDILHKLRILFWFFVIAIWAIFLYQYISTDLNSVPKIKFTSTGLSKGKKYIVEKKVIDYKNENYQTNVSSNAVNSNIKNSTSTTFTASTTNSRILIETRKILDIPPLKEDKTIVQKENIQEKIILESIKGFTIKESKHFYIYEEGNIVEKDLEDTLELIHGEIMLDLVAFSPWKRDKKVFIYYSKNSSTYQELTGRPSWSGGAANSSERKIYVYESPEAIGILAHELTHIYFDSFFEERVDPLWLSEGMAVYIQVERAKSYPRWLKENLEILKKGGGYKLSDLIKITNLDEADDKSIKLWYAQSYSLVHFLMKAKRGEAFYNFCKNIKDGKNVSLSLYNAYGSPYNKLSSLEVIWRYDLKTGKLSQLNQ